MTHEIHVHPPQPGETGTFVLEQARADVHQVLGPKPVNVFIHAGEYLLEKPFRLTPLDFGTESTPVTWTAAGDGEVRISGAQAVTVTRQSPTEPATAQLSATQEIGSLLLDGERLHSARYPRFEPENPYFGGFLYADEPPNGEEPTKTHFWSRDLGLQGLDLVGAELIVFPRHNYRNNPRRIAAHCPNTGEITLETPTTYEIDPGDRFYIQRLPDSGDDPNTWTFSETGLLSINLPDDRLEATVHIPVLDHILVIQGDDQVAPKLTVDNWAWWDDDLRRLPAPQDVPSAYLTISGITFEGSLDTAVQIENVAEVTVSGCTIRHAGNHGLAIVGGRDCLVEACEVSQTGTDGVLIAAGLRRPFNWVFTPSNHTLRNCYVHHTGLEEKHTACVAISGIAITVEHCLIHDGPRWGILFRGNHHRLLNNHVRHVNIETADTAGINCCDRDRTMYGTLIQDNIVHDVLGYNRTPEGWQTPSYAFGIYLDDWTSGVTVNRNLTYNTVRGGIYLNSGSNNVVTNNCCIGGKGELAYYNRWDYEMESERMGTRDGLRRNRVERNILVGPAQGAPIYGFGRMFPANGEIDIDSNTWNRNLVWNQGHDLEVRFSGEGGTRMIPWAEWQETFGQDRDSILADPDLGEDFSLAPDSPAHALDIEMIDVTNVGLIPDQRYPHWPPAEATGVREHNAAGVLAK